MNWIALGIVLAVIVCLLFLVLKTKPGRDFWKEEWLEKPSGLSPFNEEYTGFLESLLVRGIKNDGR